MSRKDGQDDMLDSSSEHFLEQEPGHAAERQLLVGVDAPITPAAQHALHTTGAFFAPYVAHLHLLVLTVIPTCVGYMGHPFAKPPFAPAQFPSPLTLSLGIHGTAQKIENSTFHLR